MLYTDDNLYKIFTSHKLQRIDIIVDTSGIIDLKHQDYKEKRIPIIIRDTFNNEISTKIDIEVHTEYSIMQDELYFNTCIDNEQIKVLVNSKEIIFSYGLNNINNIKELIDLIEKIIGLK